MSVDKEKNDENSDGEILNEILKKPLLINSSIRNIGNHNCVNNFDFTNSAKKSKDLLYEVCLTTSETTIKCAIYDYLLTISSNKKYNILELTNELEKILSSVGFINELRSFINKHNLGYCQIVKYIRAFKENNADFEAYLLKDTNNHIFDAKFTTTHPDSWNCEHLSQFVKFAGFRSKINSKYGAFIGHEIISKIFNQQISGHRFFSYNNNELFKFCESTNTFIILTKISNEIITSFPKITTPIESDKENYSFDHEVNTENSTRNENAIIKMMEDFFTLHYFPVYHQILNAVNISNEKKSNYLMLENKINAFLLEIFIICEQETDILKNKFIDQTMKLFSCEDKVYFGNIVTKILKQQLGKQLKNGVWHDNIDNIVANIFSTISINNKYSKWCFLANLKYGTNNEFDIFKYISNCCMICWHVKILYEETKFSFENFIKNFVKNSKSHDIIIDNGNSTENYENVNTDNKNENNDDEKRDVEDDVNTNTQNAPDNDLSLILMNNMRVAGLQKALKQLKLPFDGTKDVLIKRLQHALYS